MQQFKHVVYLLLTGILFAGILLNFAGCSRDTLSTANSIEQESKQTRKHINLISWRDGKRALLKSFNTSQYINKADGGTLSISADANDGTTNNAEISVDLTILPGAIDISKELSMTFDDTDIALTFGPHGTTFSPSALLNLTATGLDLTGVNPESVELYYENTNTGLWELMPREDIVVIPDQGYIRVVNAELPHFSRYALSNE